MCGPGRRRNNTAPAKTVTAMAFQGFFLRWMRVLIHSRLLQYLQLWVVGGLNDQLLVLLDQINRYTLFTIMFRSTLPQPFSTILTFHIETQARINSFTYSWLDWCFLLSFQV